MPKYKVVKSFPGSRTGAVVEEFVKGTTVDLDGDLEVIAKQEKWVKPVASSSSEDNVSSDRLFQLVNAVSQLEKDNERHWTISKGPECAALGEITKTTVSAVERDIAWKYVQENKDYLK